jgi:polar amino acid transport system substrate-binding protein
MGLSLWCKLLQVEPSPVKLPLVKLSERQRAKFASAVTIIAALALCFITFSPQQARCDSLVFLPSFWDPNHRLEKPDLVGIHSLRFLTEDDYPPFNFTAADGTLVGFNVDLARAICEELKVTCTIQARRWDTLIQSLDDGLGDAVIASLKINADNRAKLDFTAPYFKMPARFVLRIQAVLSDISPEGLAGKTIGVEAHSAHQAYLETFFSAATIKAFDTPAALRAALKQGEIDALFGDGVTLSQWLNSKDAENCCAFRGGPFMESRFFGEGAGIGIMKGNSALRRALDYALASLAEKGIYTDLYLKYFPIGIY